MARLHPRHRLLSRDVSMLVDASRHAAVRGHWGGPFVRVLIIIGTAACAAGALLLLSASRRRLAVRAGEGLCYAAAALPVSAYALQIFPWWRWPVAATIAIVAGCDLVLVAVASVAARRRPPWGGLGVVAGVTVVVLGVDLLTGTHLQLDGLLGDSTTVAGRFHGAGNGDFAVFATATLLSAGFAALVIARRGWAFAAAVALGVAALVLDGAPMFGDDLEKSQRSLSWTVLGLLLGVRLGH